MMYFSRLKTAVILGALPARRDPLHPEPVPRPGRLAAVAHRASRPGPARRLLPAARGGHEGGGQGAAGQPGRRRAPGAAARRRSSIRRWRRSPTRTASCCNCATPTKTDAAVAALRPLISRRGTDRHARNSTSPSNPDGTITADAVAGRAERPRPGRGAAVDRDRPPPHRRNRRGRSADHPAGRQPHRGAVARHRRSQPDQGVAGQDRAHDVPAGGRDGERERRRRRRRPATSSCRCRTIRTRRSRCASGWTWTAAT